MLKITRASINILINLCEVGIMNTKLFAIKMPAKEKNAMEYISNSTNNTLSKLFYKSIQDAIYSKLGMILLYKIDLRNNSEITEGNIDLTSLNEQLGMTLPIIEDFIGLMLEKNLKTNFWSIFKDIPSNEKSLIFQNFNLTEIATHLGKEYLARHGDFEELDLNLARNIFFNYMLLTYFNIAAVGSIQKLNQLWQIHQHNIQIFQDQLLNRYLTKFHDKKVEAIKVDEILEVSEYIE